jgi:hypothetical protein
LHTIRRRRDVAGTGDGGCWIMGIKQTRTLSRGIVALTVCVLSGCSFEQILIGQWYSVVTPSAGACQALNWQFVVNPQRMMSGFLSGNGQQRMGSLSGQLNQDDGFQMTVTDAGGKPTATVTGRFTSQVSTISIHGPGAGTGCDGQTFSLRLSGYFARQGGGGGGGG